MLMVPSILEAQAAQTGKRSGVKYQEKRKLVSRRQTICITEVIEQVSEIPLVELRLKEEIQPPGKGTETKGLRGRGGRGRIVLCFLTCSWALCRWGFARIFLSCSYAFHSCSKYFTEMPTMGSVQCLELGISKWAEQWTPPTLPCFACIPQDEQTVQDDSQSRSRRKVWLWCYSPWNLLTCSGSLSFVFVLITKHSFVRVALNHSH